jgi:hypothetical protein
MYAVVQQAAYKDVCSSHQGQGGRQLYIKACTIVERILKMYLCVRSNAHSVLSSVTGSNKALRRKQLGGR